MLGLGDSSIFKVVNYRDSNSAVYYFDSNSAIYNEVLTGILVV